jgi:hypothetical protein
MRTLKALGINTRQWLTSKASQTKHVRACLRKSENTHTHMFTKSYLLVEGVKPLNQAQDTLHSLWTHSNKWGGCCVKSLTATLLNSMRNAVLIFQQASPTCKPVEHSTHRSPSSQAARNKQVTTSILHCLLSQSCSWGPSPFPSSPALFLGSLCLQLSQDVTPRLGN